MVEDNKRGGGSSERGFASMDPEKQREIASKGGSESPGNFKNDPERAAEAGRKGGEMSGGNFKNDPQRAAEAGRKGAARVASIRAAAIVTATGKVWISGKAATPALATWRGFSFGRNRGPGEAFARGG